MGIKLGLMPALMNLTAVIVGSVLSKAETKSAAAAITAVLAGLLSNNFRTLSTYLLSNVDILASY